MNSVNLIGRITKDPEIRYTSGSTPIAVCSFTLAVDRRNKNKETDWIRCIAFGKTAELMDKYISKGRQMGITGRIQTGSYEDKEGRTVYTTDVVVDRMYFIGSGNGSGSGNQQSAGTAAPPQQMQQEQQMEIPEGFEVIDDDDVPF